MLVQILKGTPAWVFVLFFALIALGTPPLALQPAFEMSSPCARPGARIPYNSPDQRKRHGT